MVSKNFGGKFFGSIRCRIISSANRDILTVCLPICIPFISSWLIALARNYCTVLTGSGDRDTLVSFLIFGEMVSVFHH
jgi:hypothetical protein